MDDEIKRAVERLTEGEIVSFDHARQRMIEAAALLKRLVAERDAAREDAERLNWLEAFINEHGYIHLHDGQHPLGTGLGLRPGALNRTLREAIDAARASKRGEAVRRRNQGEI
jgi:hypothetical protein